MFLEDARTRVKVCGLTRLDHARYCSGALADFLGFIFVEESPRYIKPEEASAIITWLEGIQAVGVFKNHAVDEINEIVRMTGLNLVQLHGEESPESIALLDVPAIKAIGVSSEDTRASIQYKIEPYLYAAEYLLFDTKIGDQAGGTGQSFDWSILDVVPEDIRFFVAGGVSKQNIAEIIQTVEPFAIDVNSSLESEPGVKDFDKMESFFETLRQIWDEQY